MTEETGRGYTQVGAGAYPLSEPETKAVFDFLMRHPNVGIAQSLDTSVPMILRGPSTSKSEESMFPEDSRDTSRKFDQKGLEITGYPWAGDTFFVYANRGRGGAPPPPERAGQPLFGHGPDFGYLYYGAIWYGNEIWNGGRLQEADADKNGTTDDVELLQWLDANRPGKNDFQPWTKAHASDARRGRGRRLESEVLVAESAARDARDVGAQRGDVQPVPGAAARAGARSSVGHDASRAADGAFEVTADGDERGRHPDGARDREAREDRAARYRGDSARAGPDVCRWRRRRRRRRAVAPRCRPRRRARRPGAVRRRAARVRRTRSAGSSPASSARSRGRFAAPAT